MFLLPSLVTVSSFMTISLLVLELWQFPIIKDWSEIRKWELPMPAFFPISGNRGKLGILNLAWMFLIKCYWKLVLFLSCYGKIGLINEGSEDKMAKEKKRYVIKRENLNLKIMKTVYKQLSLIMKYIIRKR